jgi:hypothetical protein
MQGFVFIELKKYLATRFGEDAWKAMQGQFAPAGGAYVPGQNYSDAELGAVLRAACENSGLSHEKLLYDFGEFLVPDLLSSYRAFISPEWKTLDLLEYTEVSMHAAVRLRDPQASPPGLKCTRKSPDEVVIEYSSPRRLCPLAKGIIGGIAAYYAEKVLVMESKCMHRGDPLCVLSVRLLE